VKPQSTKNTIFGKTEFFYGGREVGCTPFQTLKPKSKGAKAVAS